MKIYVELAQSLAVVRFILSNMWKKRFEPFASTQGVEGTHVSRTRSFGQLNRIQASAAENARNIEIAIQLAT